VSTMTKLFIVLTSVLAIAVSCLFVAAAAQWENWRVLAQQYQVERNAAITQMHAAQVDAYAALAMKDEALADRAREIEENQKTILRLNEELAKARAAQTQAVNEKLAAEAGRTKLQEILDVQTAELKAVQKQNQTLLAQNIDLQSRNARTNARVLELTTNVTILTDQVRNMQEKLLASEQQLARAQQVPGLRPAVSVAPPGAAPVQPPVKGEIRGQIIEVSGNYASINVGETSGVVPGLSFMVYRDMGTYLGELEIDAVRPKESGGKLTALAAGEVRPGDLVIYGLE
jgi:hypothetical protein